MRTVTAIVTALILTLSAQAQAPAPQAKDVSRFHSEVAALVRETEGRLQEIAGDVESGDISAEAGSDQKLDATRAMLARLNTLLAVYDSRAGGQEMNATVSVRELLAASREPRETTADDRNSFAKASALPTTLSDRACDQEPAQQLFTGNALKRPLSFEGVASSNFSSGGAFTAHGLAGK